MITLLIPTALRPFVDGKSSVEVNGETVSAAITGLTAQYPDIKRHIYDENGEIRSFINFYLGENNIKSIQGLETPVKEGDEVMLVPAIAGGSQYA
jgi:molybdopterin converting factor small subunit